MSQLFIGLMSGTSLDGVDVAIVDFSEKAPQLVHACTFPYPNNMRKNILALCQPGENEIERMGSMDTALGEHYAKCILDTLKEANINAQQIRAIGSHGQTIRHRPEGRHPFSLQIGNPNMIAYQTGITTVADLRRADMAARGQGAPLVPAFHQWVLQNGKKNRVVVNIGGIANITVLSSDIAKPIIGFDTGPGNGLMNAWIKEHQNVDYDDNGDWAKQGNVDDDLLQLCLSDDYFSLEPPKSTGREYFHLEWIQRQLNTLGKTISPVDVQTTLAELTAQSIALDIKRHAPEADEVFVCGGGYRNALLMQHLEQALDPVPLRITSDAGIDPDFMEAMTFAWLAKQRMEELPGNLPSVTGARQPVILGGVYSASHRHL